MLGSYLEVALSTADIRASCEFYERLGFGSAVTGDVWAYHYGVMTSGTLRLGLHGKRQPSPAVIFTRANVARLAAELRSLGIPLASARLDTDVFNELDLRDPSGLTLRVLEARTFSPPAAVPEATALGRFVALSLPLRDLETGERFWQQLGAVATRHEEPWPHLAADAGELRLTFHAPRLHDQPLLLFHQPQLATARRLLAESGINATEGLGGFGVPPHLLVESPEGQLIALLA